MRRLYLSLNRVTTMSEFLGRDVVRLFLVSLTVGAALSFVELSFAYTLQAVFAALGLMDPSVARLPEWMLKIDLNWILMGFFLVGTGRALLQWSQITIKGYCLEAMKHLQRVRILHWAFHSESVSSSQVVTLFNEHTNSAGVAVMSFQAVLLLAATGLILGISLFLIAPITTLTIVVSLGVLAFSTRALNRRVVASSKGLQQEWDKANHRLLVSIKNLILIQIYGTQAREEERTKQSLKAYRHHFCNYHRISGFKFALPNILGLALICIVIARSRAGSEIVAGTLMTYLYLLVRFVQTVSEAGKQFSYVVVNFPHISTLEKWWRMVGSVAQKGTEVKGAETPVLAESAKPFGWEMRNIGFSYSPGGAVVLRNLSLSVAPGSALIMTGPSGAGKSTVLHLLLGMLKPDVGAISIRVPQEGKAEGITHDLASVKSSILKQIGYVGPESFLIEGTIEDNLLYGLDHAPPADRIDSVIQQAECQFVYEFSEGIHHRISEQGHGLSAGQKQRIALARALLRSPKALVLDEATANLDSRTEARVVDTLMRLKGEMTILIVSHKEALTRVADQALVFPIDAAAAGSGDIGV